MKRASENLTFILEPFPRTGLGFSMDSRLNRYGACFDSSSVSSGLLPTGAVFSTQGNKGCECSDSCGPVVFHLFVQNPTGTSAPPNDSLRVNRGSERALGRSEEWIYAYSWQYEPILSSGRLNKCSKIPTCISMRHAPDTFKFGKFQGPAQILASQCRAACRGATLFRVQSSARQEAQPPCYAERLITKRGRRRPKSPPQPWSMTLGRSYHRPVRHMPFEGAFTFMLRYGRPRTRQPLLKDGQVSRARPQPVVLSCT